MLPAVAVAALEQAVEPVQFRLKISFLLNITGGGVARIKEDYSQYMLQPDVTVSQWEEAVQFLEGRS